MLKDHLSQLSEEMKLGSLPPVDEFQFQPVKIGAFDIKVKDIEPGCYLISDVGPLPDAAVGKREEFLMLAMKANFLGQGTGGAALGLKEDESCLTLSLTLPYEMTYKVFKDNLEEFINYLDYWKKEIIK